MNTVYNILNNKPGAGLLASQLSAVAKNGRGYVFTPNGVVRFTTSNSGTLTITQVRAQRRGRR